MQVLLRGLTWRRLLVPLVDHVLIVSGILLAVSVRGAGVAEATNWPTIWRAMVIAALLQLALHYRDLYDPRTSREPRMLLVRLLQALGGAGVVLALLLVFYRGVTIGLGVVAVAAGLIVVSLTAWRLLAEWLASRIAPRERLLIVGRSGAALDLAYELEERRSELGVEVLGFIDSNHGPTGPEEGIIGTTADIPRLVREQSVSRVVVSLADARGKFPMHQFLEMKLNEGVRFDHLASVYAEYTGKIAVENLRPSWLVFSEGFRRGAVTSAAKRAMDIVLSGIALVLLSPILLVVGLLVRFTSPGPALYHQRRVGLQSRPFTVHKFRSMRQDAERGTGAVWAQKGDPRVTPVGRFLRRTRLDELPQLWNILRGDMSLVGPRPERPEFVEELKKDIPFYGQRHVVRPGLTGWAQVRHAYGSTIEDALQKLQYDLYYIQNLSVAFDIFIMLETVKTILMRRGS